MTITATTIGGQTLNYRLPAEALAGFPYFFGRSPQQFCAECDSGQARSDHLRLLLRAALIGAGATVAEAERKSELMLKHDEAPHRDPRQILAAQLVRQALAE